MTPYEGARLIWRNLFWQLDAPEQMSGFVGLASEWEERPDVRDQLRQDIVGLANETLAARTYCRSESVGLSDALPVWGTVFACLRSY